MIRVKLLAACFLLAALFWLTACGSQAKQSDAGQTASQEGQNQTDNAAAENPKPEKTEIKVATVASDWSVQLPQWVAKSEGYFKDEGFDKVDLPVVGPGNTHLAALIAGSFDMSCNLSTDAIIRANDKGESLQVIAGWSNTFNYALYARSEIKTIDDLKGKIIAIDQPGSTNDNMAREMLKHFNMEPGKDVALIPVGAGPQRTAAVVGGSAQAAISLLTDTPRLEAQGIKALFKMSELYPDFSFGVITAKKDFVEQNPNTTRAFMRAILRGYQYIEANKDNPDNLIKIIQDNGGTIDSAVFPAQLKIWLGYVATDGLPNVKGLEVVAEREVKAGRVKEGFDIQPYISLDPLKAAQKDLGL